MSLDERERRGSQSPDPDRLWRKVLLKEKEGAPLTDTQIRALEIRRAAIDIVGAMGEIVEDPTLEEDIQRQAGVVATYWQGMIKLQDMGVTEGMHVGEPQEAFQDPVVMAEWYAGQLIGREVDRIPTARQAFMQAQEHSTEEDQMPVSENVSALVLDASKLSPSFKNWLVVRSIVNLGYRFLSIDLDKPHQPTAEQV